MGGFSAGADAVEEHSVGRNSAVMAAGTMVSRVLGLVRTSMLGAAVGMGAVGDAFNGANTLPNYLFLLLSGGLLEPVIVPQITKAAKREDSKKYVDQLVTASLGISLAVAVLATVAAPLLSRLLQLTPEAQRLGLAFAFICLPQTFFYCLTTVLSQVLNARGKYGAPMWAPALNNVVSIIGFGAFIGLYGSGQSNPATWTEAMIWLFGGTATLGIVAQGLILIPPLMRSGFRWQPRWGFPADEFKHLSRYTFWTFLALLISTIGGMVILSITSSFPSKAEALGIDGFVAGNSIYANAFLIFMLPQSIIAVSVITALFPPMTRAWQSDDMPGMRRLVKQGLDLPAVFLLPATVAMIALAGPLVHVIFPGNTDAELHALAWVLIAMCVGMTPMAIQTLQQKYCFASEQGRTNLLFQLVITVTQLAVAWCAVAFADPRHGVLIVACAQSAAYIVVAIVFALFARRQLGGLSLAGTVRLYVRLLLASLISAVGAWAAAWGILRVGQAWLWQLLALGVGCLVFVAIFTVVAKAIRLEEYFDLLRPILKRLKRS